MDPATLSTFGVFGAAIVLAAAAYAVCSHVARKRREAVAKLAAERGFDFASEVHSVECGYDLRLTDVGHSHQYLNLVRGHVEEMPFLLFDHTYHVGSGKSESTVYRTVAAFQVVGTLSPFELRPENLLDKVGSWLGMQDVDFPENPDFSGAYLLRASDEKKTRLDFNRNVLAFFSGHHGWNCRGGGPWVGFYKAEKKMPPERLWEFLEEARFGSTFFCP